MISWVSVSHLCSTCLIGRVAREHLFEQAGADPQLRGQRDERAVEVFVSGNKAEAQRHALHLIKFTKSSSVPSF